MNVGKNAVSLGVIGIIAGALMGPGYLLYTAYYSGESVQTFEVHSGQAVRVGSVTLSTSGGNRKSWFTIELTPEMNPIAIIASAKYPSSTSTIAQNNTYSCRLTSGEKEIWQEEFGITRSRASKKPKGKGVSIDLGSSQSYSKRVKMFSVAKAGTYGFEVKTIQEKFPLSELSLEFRRNVSIAKREIFIPGCIILGVSFVGLVVISASRKKAARRATER